MQMAADLYTDAKRFGDAYAAALRPLCDELGMAQTAVDILLFLANNPKHNTAREICVYRNLKPGIVSFHVENLVTGGYLVRQEKPEDRRKCMLLCTEKAEPIVRRGRKVQERFFTRLAEGIAPEEMEICRACMEKINRNAEALLKEEALRRLTASNRYEPEKRRTK